MFIAVYAHNYYSVITQFVDVEIVAPDAAAQRGDERPDFRRCEHLVEARLLHVENFSLERQDRLRAAVASLFGGAAGRVALDQEHLPWSRLFPSSRRVPFRCSCSRCASRQRGSPRGAYRRPSAEYCSCSKTCSLDTNRSTAWRLRLACCRRGSGTTTRSDESPSCCD